jgi:hypothetical protein
MFYCERCQSKFNATVGASGECPRCKETDAVASPLRFRIFEPSALRVAGLTPHHRGHSGPGAQAAK